MVSVLPGARSPWDLIGEMTGQNLMQTLPGAIQQGYQRQLGLNALDQAQKKIEQAGNDPYKIALALAKAGTQNPNLERSLAPLMQTAVSEARIKNAFGNKGQAQSQTGISPSNLAQNATLAGMGEEPIQAKQMPVTESPNVKKQVGLSGMSDLPSPFRIYTPQQMESIAQNRAAALQDPNAYQSTLTSLQNLNEIASNQRQNLEDFALKAGVEKQDLPMFMKIGEKFDVSDPSKWAIEATREWKKYKNKFDAIDRAFMPGLGTGLIYGKEGREQGLKNLENTVQSLVEAGFEQEVRDKLSDGNNYLTPTEIGKLIYPVNKQQENEIKKIPKGIFPKKEEKKQTPLGGYYVEKSPFLSYEEAQLQAPKEMQLMNNILSDFFMKNVNEKTSLLALREKIMNERDYDWRQFGPAIRQAEKNGLQLSPQQQAEMTDIETQAPYDSLPYLFKDFTSRLMPYLRGAK